MCVALCDMFARVLTCFGCVRLQVKIQQALKDKKDALTAAKEVTTKLENEKKVRGLQH